MQFLELLQFLQHFLPGTPVEENRHISYGLLFKRFLNFEDYSVIGGIQIEVADAELVETQANAFSFDILLFTDRAFFFIYFSIFSFNEAPLSKALLKSPSVITP